MVSCPDDAALAAFLDHGPGSGSGDVEDHLQACATCRILLASAAAPESGSRSEPSALRCSDMVTEQPGRYELERVCGRGGQSIVWTAFDRNLGCHVAFKVLQTSLAVEPRAEARASARFLREARIAASLSHPAIVPVHELGTRADGSLYYTMKLVRGRTLAEALAATSSLEQRLGLLGHVIDVCQGIAYAHKQGVVHRDIKPGNVMVGEFGETIIVDWGLAKPIDEEDAARLTTPDPRRDRSDTAHETVSGTSVGTPAYMSPEQAAGRPGEVDERSDVWGLGTLVYELLAGAPPFSGRSAGEVIDRVIRGDRPAVSAGCPDAPPALAAIAERALARDPAERYPAADALAAELIAYAGGGRVRSYRYSAWELVSRFAAIHRAAFVAIVAIVAVAFASAIAVAFAYRSEAAARERAEAATQAETTARRRASAALTRAYADKSEQLSSQGQHLSAQIYAAGALVATAEQSLAGGADPALRLRALSVLHEAAQQPVIGREHRFSPGGRVGLLAFAPDGRTVFGANEQAVTTFSVDQGRVTATAPIAAKPVGLAAAADGAALVVASKLEHSVAITGDHKSALLATTGPASAFVAAVSADGSTIATGDRAGTIVLWDRSRGRRAELAGHTGLIIALEFSPDGAALVSGGRDGTVRVWDVARAAPRALFRGHNNFVRDVAFSHDGLRVVSGGQDRTIRIWSLLAPDQPPIVLEGHHTPVSALAISADDRLLASGDYEGQFRIWDLRTSTPLVAVQAHETPLASPLGVEISAIAFSPDGSRLATGAVDGSTAIWSLRAPQPFAARLPAMAVFYTRLSRDGRVIAVPCANQQVAVHDIRRGRRIEIPVPAAVTQAVALTPDSRLMALAGEDGTIRVWDLERMELREITGAHAGGVSGVEFSPDGSMLISGGDDGVVRMWHRDTLASARELRGRGESYTGFAYSPDGSRLAGVESGGAITVWAADTFTELARIDADGWGEVAFSHDGSRLIAAGQHGFRIWSATDWQVVDRVDTGSVYTRAVFGPADRSIVTASYDGTVKVWSVSDVRPLISIPTTTPTVAVTPDGETLVLPRGNVLTSIRLDRSLGDRAAGELLRSAEISMGARLDGFDLRGTGG